MIVYRYHNNKGGYNIKDTKGNIITDSTILDYVKSLVIPPAYENVKIYYIKSPKIVFEGYDSKGRKQQIYSKKWREQADKKKYRDLIEFGNMMTKIKSDINTNIIKKKITKDKLISLILKMILLCKFRVGSDKYHKLYNSHGVITLQKRHIIFTLSGAQIEFIGKKGMLNQCTMTDPIVINELKNLVKNIKENDFIFVCDDKLIQAVEVNNYLKKYNENFTTKMFRTFDANVLLIEHLTKHEEINKLSLSARKKIVNTVLGDVSSCINNTPAICKKSYIDPGLIDMFVNEPNKFKRNFKLSNISHTKMFINYLSKK